MATEKPRFTISIDYDLAEALDDYRFGHRIERKSDAITQLIRIGLETVREREEAMGGDRR